MRARRLALGCVKSEEDPGGDGDGRLAKAAGAGPSATAASG